ncbi:MAG: prepilin-type N-terminal cleavage/methylation domain-containing protein [Halobacteriovoraceae bacterium]|jgi:prepilin-type N-terminal cleavage/methylation domain-containing protein|nr:prepilin-type N-terminal cleavage/methylation domain-containing protein [Halobacteriovoraceae bacterium]MBT5095331.1 prepilin-type N-terminal cleavage/methylation domain-containing protein [Halobacteriovoraceae bacterium]
MVKIVQKFQQSQRGMTLIEVMIALALFAVFITAFMGAQGYNISSSTNLKEEIFLKELTIEKLNEVILDPPDLKDSLTVAPVKKSFEGYPDYEYTITYKKFLIPDLSKIQGESAGESNPFEKQIFSQIKENMEKLLWQVNVLVKSKATNSSYGLTTWLYNAKAKVVFSGL